MPVIGYSRTVVPGGSSFVAWSASSLALPSGMALTRASAGRVLNFLTPSLTQVAVDTPRYFTFANSEVLLWVEGARSNVAPSLDITDGNWDRAASTVTSGISDPFGGTAAYRVTGSSYVCTSVGTYATTGFRSIWARSVTGAGTQNIPLLRDSRDGPTSSVTETWQRFSLGVAGLTNFPGYIYIADMRLVTGGQIEIYWPQQETGVDFLGSPVGAATGRANENLLSSIIYAPAGGWSTLHQAYTAGGIGSTDGDQVLDQVDDGTASNRCLVRRDATTRHIMVERYSGGSLAGSLAASIGGATAVTGTGQLDMGLVADSTEFHLAITWPAPPTGLTNKRFGRDTTGHYWFGGIRRRDEMTPQTNTSLGTLSA